MDEDGKPDIPLLQRRCLLIGAGAWLLPGTAAARFFHRTHPKDKPNPANFLQRPVFPDPPKYPSWIVMDARGNQIAGHDADEERATASLAKLMTLYLLCKTLDVDARLPAKDRAFRQGLDTPVTISAEAANTKRNGLGLITGTRVRLRTLAAGMMDFSANDAAIQVGLALAGSTDAMADMMNAEARRMGLLATILKMPSGQDIFLPHRHAFSVSNAREMALLAMRVQGDFGAKFPDILHPDSITFNRRHQQNIEHEILGQHIDPLGRVLLAKTGTGHAGHNEALVFTVPVGNRGSGQQPDSSAVSYSLVYMGAKNRSVGDVLRRHIIDEARAAIAKQAMEARFASAAKPPVPAPRP